MKVLFALGSEQTSKKVAEKYLEKFGIELEYKNVFYFKALLEEVKNNKSYDRIVISEELEQFELKNIEALDKFIFNNVDNVTDEIEDSEIIFICSDRRSRDNDKFVERLFNIGVYNTLIGDERNISSLCEYIKNPMNKKEAKRHLNINPVVSDTTMSTRDDEVEEAQIVSIRNYYENIKGRTEEYVPAFDRIAEQYSRNQLKVILKFLPTDVKKEILSSEKYLYLNDNNTAPVQNAPQPNVIKTQKRGLFGILKDNKSKETYTRTPNVIVENKTVNDDKAKAEQEALEKEKARLAAEEEALRKAEQEAIAKQQEILAQQQEELRKKAEQEALAREQAEQKMKEQQQSIDNTNKKEQSAIEEARKKLEQEKQALEEARQKLKEQSEQLKNRVDTAVKVSTNYANMAIKKMVTLVGANKSGTTFLTNALAHQLSLSGIMVGILDMTRDKSLYYIYNQNDKELRRIASECFQRLADGDDVYIPVKKNLKVYTSIPNGSNMKRGEMNRSIIETVKDSNGVVIVDADFSTPFEYFERAQEIYIVQDMDIIRMQDTTMFLRELKNRNIDMKKVKIIINKYVKCLLTPKKIIEGLSYYNDPQMSFIDEILDTKVQHFMIPFNLDNYAKYIDCMYKNTFDYRKFSPDFIQAIDNISRNIYNIDPNSGRRRGIFG